MDGQHQPQELHRKAIAEAFWNAEMEAELRASGNISHHFHSVRGRENLLMEKIDKERVSTTYSHSVCSDECKKRGSYVSFIIKINVWFN